MAKTIKVIDLLNMQYKNEEMPKNIRIKYSFVFDYYIYNEEMKWYETADKTSILDVFQKLDYEVEIIEEQQDIDIQEIEMFEQEYFNEHEGNMSVVDVDLAVKINEILTWAKQTDNKIKDKE